MNAKLVSPFSHTLLLCSQYRGSTRIASLHAQKYVGRRELEVSRAEREPRIPGHFSSLGINRRSIFIRLFGTMLSFFSLLRFGDDHSSSLNG